MHEFKYNDTITEAISGEYGKILAQIGEDPNREGLLRTPERVAKALQFLTQGYDQNPEEIFAWKEL